MHRREFFPAVASAGLGAAIALNHPLRAQESNTASSGFKLKYAPHFGMFKNSAGNDLVDQLKFAADQGFTAWEDNGMKGRSVDDQKRIAKAMDELGMEMHFATCRIRVGRPLRR